MQSAMTISDGKASSTIILPHATGSQPVSLQSYFNSEDLFSLGNLHRHAWNTLNEMVLARASNSELVDPSPLCDLVSDMRSIIGYYAFPGRTRFDKVQSLITEGAWKMAASRISET